MIYLGKVVCVLAYSQHIVTLTGGCSGVKINHFFKKHNHGTTLDKDIGYSRAVSLFRITATKGPKIGYMMSKVHKL